MTTVRAKYLGGLRVECEHLQSGAKIVTDAPVDNHGKERLFLRRICVRHHWLLA